MKVMALRWRSVWGGGRESGVKTKCLRLTPDFGLQTPDFLTKEAVDVVVGDLGEERLLRVLPLGGEAPEFVEDHGEVARRLLDAQLDEAEAGALVEDHDEQDAADDADVDALTLALVRERGELLLADEARHPARGGDVAGRQRGQARRVQVAHVAVRGDLLAVLVHEKDDAGERVETQLAQDEPELLELLLVHYDRRVCHSYTGSLYRRIRTLGERRGRESGRWPKSLNEGIRGLGL